MQNRVPELSYLETLWRSSTWENWREESDRNRGERGERLEEREERGKREIKDVKRDRLSFGTWATVAVLFCGRKRYQARIKRHDRRGKEGGFAKQLMPEISSLDLLSSTGGLFFSPPRSVCRSWFGSSHIGRTSQNTSNQSQSSRSFSFAALNVTSAGKPPVNSECLQRGGSSGSSVAVSLWHVMELLQVSISVLLPQKNLKFLPDEFHRLRSSHRCSSEVG